MKPLCQCCKMARAEWLATYPSGSELWVCGDCDGDHDNPLCPMFRWANLRGAQADAVRSDLQLAADMRVLLGWAALQDNSGQVTVYNSDGLHWCCGLHGRASRGYLGDTPEAAIHAAAESLRALKGKP